jgi:MFS family permease
VALGRTLEPLAERPFRLLWLGRVSSAAGDSLISVALAFAVLSVDRSATALGSVLAAFTLSRIVFTLAGGVLADRLPRRTVMLASDLARAVVEAFTAAMLLTHHMTLPLFFVTGAIFGAASAFFAPASDGFVPQTVSAVNLQAANALIYASRNLLNIFGPAVSGALIAAFGPGWVFAINSASFVLSAVFLVQLKVAAHVHAEPAHFARQLHDGFREVISRPWVRAPIAGFAISNLCLAAFIVLGPPIFVTHFDGARDWGVVSAFGAFGAVVGALVSVRLRPRHPLTACFAAAALLALPIAALGPPLPFGLIAVGWAIGAGAIAVGNTWWETTLQRDIPTRVYARVRSYDLLVSFVFMPLGYLLFPLIARAAGAGPTLLVTACVAGLSSIVVAVAPGVRVVTEEPVAATLKPA